MFEAARWLHHDDSDIDLLGQFGIWRIGPDYQPSRLHVPPPVTANLVTGLSPAFRSLRPTDRGRVILALGRLVKARCQLVPGNRAIDLAIALEVLFMNADRDEHSFKISLRASRLLRDTGDARSTTFAEVKALYDMRSKMVHTGRAHDKWSINGDQRNAYQVVEAVDSICVEAIRKLLSLGKIPDRNGWRTYELG